MRFRAAYPYIRPGARVCDLGCGLEAGFLDYASDRIAMGVGVDDQVEEGVRGRWQRVRADLRAPLPFPDGHFDHVVMLAVLEHLTEPEKVLRGVPHPRAGRLVDSYLALGDGRSNPACVACLAPHKRRDGKRRTPKTHSCRSSSTNAPSHRFSEIHSSPLRIRHQQSDGRDSLRFAVLRRTYRRSPIGWSAVGFNCGVVGVGFDEPDVAVLEIGEELRVLFLVEFAGPNDF